MNVVGKHVWFLGEDELGTTKLMDGLVTQVNDNIATVLVINEYGKDVETRYPLWKISANKMQFTYEDGLALYTYYLKAQLAEAKPNAQFVTGSTYRRVDNV